MTRLIAAMLISCSMSSCTYNGLIRTPVIGMCYIVDEVKSVDSGPTWSEPEFIEVDKVLMVSNGIVQLEHTFPLDPEASGKGAIYPESIGDFYYSHSQGAIKCSW
jgi:hypothetical protein